MKCTILLYCKEKPVFHKLTLHSRAIVTMSYFCQSPPAEEVQEAGGGPALLHPANQHNGGREEALQAAD